MSCVLSVQVKKAKSKLKGQTQALCVSAKYESKYEFVFTSLVKNSPRWVIRLLEVIFTFVCLCYFLDRMFTTVQAVFKAYETSKLYRDLKLRGSVIKGKIMKCQSFNM